MFLHLLRIRYHFMHYLEAFVIIPKFFYLCSLQYFTIGLLQSFLVCTSPTLFYRLHLRQ